MVQHNSKKCKFNHKKIELYSNYILKVKSQNATLKKSVLLYKKTPLFDLKIGYSYVIEVADSEYQLRFRRRPLVSEIFIFPRIRVT